MSPPQAEGLLDTSTVILLGRLANAESLPYTPAISAITLAELMVGPLVATTTAARVGREAHVQKAIADFPILPFDEDTARTFSRVSVAFRSAGRRADCGNGPGQQSSPVHL